MQTTEQRIERLDKHNKMPKKLSNIQNANPA